MRDLSREINLFCFIRVAAKIPEIAMHGMSEYLHLD